MFSFVIVLAFTKSIEMIYINKTQKNNKNYTKIVTCFANTVTSFDLQIFLNL